MRCTPPGSLVVRSGVLYNSDGDFVESDGADGGIDMLLFESTCRCSSCEAEEDEW